MDFPEVGRWPLHVQVHNHNFPVKHVFKDWRKTNLLSFSPSRNLTQYEYLYFADFSLRWHLQQATGEDWDRGPAGSQEANTGGHWPVQTTDLSTLDVRRHAAGDAQHPEGQVPGQTSSMDPDNTHRADYGYVSFFLGETSNSKTLIHILFSFNFFWN